MKSKFAVWSFILSLIPLVFLGLNFSGIFAGQIDYFDQIDVWENFSLTPGVLFVIGIFAIIFGIIGLIKIHKSNELNGYVYAIFGILLGIVESIFFWIFLMLSGYS